MDPHAITPKIQPSHNRRHCNFASFSLHKLSTQRNAPSQYFLSQKKKKKGRLTTHEVIATHMIIYKNVYFQIFYSVLRHFCFCWPYLFSFPKCIYSRIFHKETKFVFSQSFSQVLNNPYNIFSLDLQFFHLKSYFTKTQKSYLLTHIVLSKSPSFSSKDFFFCFFIDP